MRVELDIWSLIAAGLCEERGGQLLVHALAVAVQQASRILVSRIRFSQQERASIQRPGLAEKRDVVCSLLYISVSQFAQLPYAPYSAAPRFRGVPTTTHPPPHLHQQRSALSATDHHDNFFFASSTPFCTLSFAWSKAPSARSPTSDALPSACIARFDVLAFPPMLSSRQHRQTLNVHRSHLRARIMGASY
jgi:hypothetical protein